ncbi:MAG: metal ABC transporter ATP-binding protein [Alphaproteobacteria bacterium]|nr:metal ABC transporter ATP-binding protein [Alphaproteobacteria bacterium]
MCLSVQNLTVERGGKAVLNDVSLQVKDHDFITIVGPNGAGKTTLLHVLLGLCAPDAGMVYRRNNLRLGFVPQRVQIELSMPITVLRFLELAGKTTPAFMDEILAIMDIASIKYDPVSSLSGGEFQRVLVARALLRKPDVLCLDEPAQNLDMGGQLAFYKLLEKLYQERRCTIIVVSHDLHMVMASSSQVICLYHHICCSGEPHIVTKDPKFQELFGDDVSKMMAVYHHTHSHTHEHEDDHEHHHHHHE